MDMDTTTKELRMPALGADMTEGKVIEWLVQPGDHVERGEIVAVVETDKADIEIEVFEAATIRELVVPPGQVVPIGTPIATFEPDRTTTTSAPPPIPEPPPTPSVPAPKPARVTSPLVRHLADERHIDVQQVAGSGPGGRVTRDDVEHAAVRQRITPRARRLATTAGLAPERLVELAASGRVVTADDVAGAASVVPPSVEPASPIDPMRRRIGELMSRSWREIPHYHLERRLDLTDVLERLGSLNAQRPVAARVLPAAVLLAATATAARTTPDCNGWWRDDRFAESAQVNLGVVLSLRSGGIIVPTIERADEIGLSEMMARLRELVDRARRGRLRGSDFAEASITVTNLGDQGADVVFGVIHPPQVALVGFGAIRDEPAPTASAGHVRKIVRASLAGDHRAIDGLTGSAFLAHTQRAIDELLREETT
jgi:pyruvate/2-oxoglutarate dehydrogenase complex dihydrolipoamide acyltransferase (E2) component